MAKKEPEIGMEQEVSLLIQESKELDRKGPRKAKGKAVKASADKPLSETTRTRAVWLDLFSAPDPDSSFTVELDEIIPKFFYGRPKRSAAGTLEPLKRIFRHRDRLYNLTILPAKLEKDEDAQEGEAAGSIQEFLPGVKEEILLDVLKKLAAERRAELIDGMVGLIFSLTEIQAALAYYGHAASFNEIKKSLRILRRSSMILRDNAGNSIEENLILTLGFSERGRAKTAYIRFNSIVAESLRNGSYRLINLKQVLSYEDTLARKLHKFISHNYTGIDSTSTYHFRLLSFMQNAGFSIHKKISRTSYYVDSALDELYKKNVIREYQKNPIIEAGKTVDFKYVVLPHHSLVRDVIKANRIQKDTMKALGDLEAQGK